MTSEKNCQLGLCFIQSHYIEVAQGAIFMEQNIRFGLIMSNFLGRFIQFFKGNKKFTIFEKNVLTSSLELELVRVWTLTLVKLHKISFIILHLNFFRFFFWH